MFQTEVVGKIKTHLLYSVFFSLENRTIYEKKGKNFERCRPQMTIWRMRFAGWIPKGTDTRSGCVNLIAFPLKRRLHEHPSMLHCLSCSYL